MMTAGTVLYKNRLYLGGNRVLSMEEEAVNKEANNTDYFLAADIAAPVITRRLLQ
jgi:hypothetical protein